MSTPGISRHVPDDFWTDCVEPSLYDSLDEFEEHKELIAKESFLNDYFSCLVSFGIRQIASKKLVEKTVKLAKRNMDSMGPRSCESFLFFINNSRHTDQNAQKVI